MTYGSAVKGDQNVHYVGSEPLLTVSLMHTGHLYSPFPWEAAMYCSRSKWTGMSKLIELCQRYKHEHFKENRNFYQKYKQLRNKVNFNLQAAEREYKCLKYCNNYFYLWDKNKQKHLSVTWPTSCTTLWYYDEYPYAVNAAHVPRDDHFN